MSVTQNKKNLGAVISASIPMKALDAETVTNIALGFLKKIGNKSNLKPKRVTLEEQIYVVEVEMKKFSAVIRVDSESREIKGYEIQPRTEESSSFSISPKAIMMIFGISAAVHAILSFAFKMIGL